MKFARKLLSISMAAASTAAFAQVPDLLTSFDAGGRAFGSGGSLYGTSADTMSATYNPAGLGYVNEPMLSVSTRNFPTSRTLVTGSLTELRLNSFEREGELGLSHVGYARPSGGRGTIGVAYTVGGWYHDDQFGQTLAGGISRFHDALHIRTDFLNLSWGRASNDQSTSIGFGIIVAQNNVYNKREITFADPNIPPTLARSDESGFGVGAQFGMIFVPRGTSNVSWGFSVRTPIEIQDDEGALALYQRIPGRAAVGMALRQDGFRRGRDFLIYGAEFEYLFGGEGSDRLDIEDHSNGHVGVEYNYVSDTFTLPIRLGYSLITSGGDGFQDRNTFTYGFGYRPHSQKWSIDVGFGNANRGVKDTAITVGIRF